MRLLRNIWKKLFEMLREKAPILTVNLRTRPNEKYPCKVDWLATTRPKYNVANPTQAQKQRCQVPKSAIACRYFRYDLKKSVFMYLWILTFSHYNRIVSYIMNKIVWKNIKWQFAEYLGVSKILFCFISPKYSLIYHFQVMK